MAETADKAKESSEHWGKCMYQFDLEFAKEIADKNRPWLREEIMPRISKLLQCLDTYRILAVGSGTGCADRVVLEVISEELKSKNIKGPKLIYTVVEPDKEALEVCKRNLGAVEGLDIEFKWEAVTMEEYFKRDPIQFEMVHFIHSLCEVSRCAKIFPEVLRKNYVRHDGILFSVLGDHDKNFFLKLYFANMDKLDQHVHHGHHHDTHQHHGMHQHQDKHHHHDSDHHHNPSSRHIVGASDVENLKQVIENENWNFKMFTRVYKQDVTEILTRSSDGMRKLSFRLETREIDKVLSKEDLDDIIKQIDDGAGKKIINGEEKRLVESTNHVVILYHD